MNPSNSAGKSQFSAPPTGIPANSSSEMYSDEARTNHVPAMPQVPWSTGLWDCFSDVNNCCVTCWCPCIPLRQIAEIVDKGTSKSNGQSELFAVLFCVTGFGSCLSYTYRTKMRQQYSLQESPCGDFLVHCFCEPCAICQEYRELKHRGFDMTIGWQENMERQSRGVATAPAFESGMKR